MGTIVNKTKEFYPDLEGAEYLEFIGEEVPKNVKITFSNVSIGCNSGKLMISRFKPKWGWSYGNSFHRDFDTPEEALKHFLEIYNGAS